MKHRKQIMGVAALLIYFFHGGLPLMPQGTVLAQWQAFLQPCLQGGTDIFFLLSGVGLVYAWEKSESVTDFWLRRARRMLLPVWLSGVIVAIQWDWEMEAFVRNVSGVNFYAVHVFSYSWFYAAIATVYFLFPLYYHFFAKTQRKVIFTGLAFLLWVILSVLLRDYIRRDLYMATNRLGIFLVGVFLGSLLYKGERIRLSMLHYLAGGILLVGGCVLMQKASVDETFLPVPIAYTWLPATMAAVGATVLLVGLFAVCERSGSKVVEGFMRLTGFYGMITLEFICAQEWIGTAIERSGISLPEVWQKALLLILHTACAYVYYWLNCLFLKLADQKLREDAILDAV